MSDDISTNASEHKSRLSRLAALWHGARTNVTQLAGDIAHDARILEQDSATEFAKAQQAAERAGLMVSHDMATGLVRLFHLAEIDPPAATTAPVPNDTQAS